MDRKGYMIIVLLFVRFALVHNCDCKFVDILRNIVQREIMEREILESRVEMLESNFAKGIETGSNGLETSSDKSILERLSVIEKMIEAFNTKLEDITKERQNEERDYTAMTKAWRIHKHGFSVMKEDMNKSISDTKKSVYDLAREVDKRMEVVEFKVDKLVNQTSSIVTKQLDSVENKLEVIQFELNKTFKEYLTRLNKDFTVFTNNTDRSLNATQAEILSEECTSSPCMNGATCIDGIKNYSCNCMAGYNGKNCQTDIDECLSSPCPNGGTCNDHVNGFTCSCEDGWMGNNCEKAVYLGTSFIAGFMKDTNSNQGKPTLLIACPEGTANITVSIPALSIVNEHREFKGGMLTLNYSNTSTSYTSGLISKKGVHIIADRPVMLFAGSFRERSSDGSLVPPEISLGTDYIISGYPSGYVTNDQILIVGTEDRTMITMDINSVVVNITLNRMETYMHADYNLSGSIIFSSAPIYVLSGHSCANIPNDNVGYCDYIDETMPPISSLGKLHVVSYMKPRPDFTISIAAPFSNTSVTISDETGTEIETITSMYRMDAEFRTFTSFQTISVVATQPVLVTQYGHGSGDESDNSGDPSMMIIPDVNHFGSMYYFVAPSDFNSTLAIVMRSLNSISDLLLDDVAFKPTETISATITGYSDYLIIYGDIAPGYHKLAHRAGNTVTFGAWIYGRQWRAESLGHT